MVSKVSNDYVRLLDFESKSNISDTELKVCDAW
jgi:hypothetical protein